MNDLDSSYATGGILLPGSITQVGESDPHDTPAAVRQVCDDLRRADEAYHLALRTLAAGNASPEAVTAFALENFLRRFAGLRFGATPVETATVVVEALRETGHLPSRRVEEWDATVDQERTRSER